jgi:hypothetical protein
MFHPLDAVIADPESLPFLSGDPVGKAAETERRSLASIDQNDRLGDLPCDAVPITLDD